jgi:hypothetical protein
MAGPPTRRRKVEARHGVRLFVVGVLIGVSMFFIGGIAVVPRHAAPQPTAQLTPWLQRTVCDYPAVDCTSRGGVVTSPAVAPNPGEGS